MFWFQNGYKVIWAYLCKISFHICEYRDELLCDVIPMEACHTLLERPWQFYRCTIHGGRKNIYTIIKFDEGIQCFLLKDEEKN
jgi:hypothetical protein